MNAQLKETIQKWSSYKATANNFFASCRAQGMTRKDFEQYVITEISSESDQVKDYAAKADGSYKSVSACFKTFGTLEGFTGQAIRWANSHTVRYSNYLKAAGLDPKTCMAPVKIEAPEAVQEVAEAPETAEAVQEVAEAPETPEAVQEVAEEYQTVLKAIKELASSIGMNNTKKEMVAALNEIQKLANG